MNKKINKHFFIILIVTKIEMVQNKDFKNVYFQRFLETSAIRNSANYDYLRLCIYWVN